MNEHDPLEAELASLRPAPTSPQLRDRISRSLLPEVISNGCDQPNPGAARQAEPTWAFASAILAASILALLLWRTAERAPQRRGTPIARNESAAALDPALPSLWTYRSALAADSQELDALLAEHAQHGRSLPTPVHDLQIGPMRGFVSSEAELHSLIEGEL